MLVLLNAVKLLLTVVIDELIPVPLMLLPVAETLLPVRLSLKPVNENECTADLTELEGVLMLTFEVLSIVISSGLKILIFPALTF